MYMHIFIDVWIFKNLIIKSAPKSHRTLKNIQKIQEILLLTIKVTFYINIDTGY